MKLPGLKRWRVRTLRVLSIQPGDAFIVQGPDSMTMPQAQAVDAAFASQGIKVVVLGGGCKVVGVQPWEPPDEYAPDDASWEGA